MDEKQEMQARAEAPLLLRKVAREMEDDAIVAAVATRTGPRTILVVLPVVGIAILAQVLLEDYVERWTAFVIAGLFAMLIGIAVEVGRLRRSVAAIARTLQRAPEPRPGPPPAAGS